MELLALWVGLSLLVGAWASNWGRSAVAWFAVAVFLSPLVAAVFLAVAGKREIEAEERQIASGARNKCPFCAELIKPEAIVCKHCGRDLPKPAPPPPGPWTYRRCGIRTHDADAQLCLNCGESRA